MVAAARRSGGPAAAAACCLVMLLAAAPAAASRAALRSPAGRTLLQDQSSCCARIQYEASAGATVSCDASGLLLTVTSVEGAATAATVRVAGRDGSTAALNGAVLDAGTCSRRTGAAAWAVSGDTISLALAAGDGRVRPCTNGADGSCVGSATKPAVATTALSVRHACSIRTSDGAVLCSGDNSLGQIGNNAAAPFYDTLQAVAKPSGAGILTGATAVAAAGRSGGSGHTCACLQTGEAVCWGQNSVGQLAANAPLSATASNRRPLFVVTAEGASAPRLAGCAAVAANFNHTVFLTAGGDVYTAGSSVYNQLGLGFAAGNRNYAALVPRASLNGRAAVSVAAGAQFSCAVVDNGEVFCLGFNIVGQLGRNTPKRGAASGWGRVSGLVDATSVVAGDSFACALRRGGRVSCWGGGWAAGNNTNGAVIAPVEVLSGGAESVTAGSLHACALMSDRGAMCWGAGTKGQLGNGAVVNYIPAPSRATQLPSAVVIAAGGETTCVVNGAGRRTCVGANQSGQMAKAAPTRTGGPAAVATIVPAALGATTFAVPPPLVAVSGAGGSCSLGMRLAVANVCDYTPPVFDASTLVNRTLEATSAAGAVAAFEVTATDDMTPPVVACTPASPAQLPLGSHTVNCSASDGRTAPVYATFKVNVVDTTPPAMGQVPENITLNVDTPATTYAVTYTPPTATDAAGAAAVACAPAPGAAFPVNAQTLVTCTATDAQGLTASASFSVSIIDNTPPEIVTPPDFAVEATSAAGALWEDPAAPPPAFGAVYYDGGADTAALIPACSAVGPDGAALPACAQAPCAFPMGVSTVTCAAADANGNAAAPASFKVTVADTTAPALLANAAGGAPVAAAGPDGAVLPAGYLSIFAADEVSGAVPVTATIKGVRVDLTTYLFPIGSTEVVVSAVDAAGNVAAPLSVTVVVADLSPPAIKVQNEGNRGLTTTIKATTDTETDTSAIVTWNNKVKCKASDTIDRNPTVVYSPASGSIFPLGETEVTCTATDASGNATVEKFMVLVQPDTKNNPK